MQTVIKHYPLTTNQSEMFQEWEEDTKMTQCSTLKTVEWILTKPYYGLNNFY